MTAKLSSSSLRTTLMSELEDMHIEFNANNSSLIIAHTYNRNPCTTTIYYHPIHTTSALLVFLFLCRFSQVPLICQPSIL